VFLIPSSSTSDRALPDHAPFSAMAADAPRSAALAAIAADQPRPQLTNVFVGLLKEKPILDGDGKCSPAVVRSVRPLAAAELWKCSHAPHLVRVPATAGALIRALDAVAEISGVLAYYAAFAHC
jgi:hypothetical protein